MCGHDGERIATVWFLNDKGEKEPASFQIDGYEPETNTVYQFHGCHWHGHAWLKNRTKRQQKRYEDTRQIDWFIENNGWNTKYNLVSTWECEGPILKKVRLEKEFTSYSHFVVYDFEVILAPLDEHPTDDLTYLSRHIAISDAVHDTLSKEHVYLVNKNPKGLIKRSIEVLTGKQEAITTDALKQHPYPSNFQMLPGEVQKKWRQRVNQVPVNDFNSGKYDLNMVKEYFVKEISYNKEDEYNEDIFAAKENDYMF